MVSVMGMNIKLKKARPGALLSQRGFTLIEIMIVVAIIAMLAAIAIPNIAKARRDAQRQACIMNLKSIQAAKEAWAAANQKADGDPVDVNAVNQYLGKVPKCPSGGTYDYGLVGQPPTCSRADLGHVLEEEASQ